MFFLSNVKQEFKLSSEMDPTKIRLMAVNKELDAEICRKIHQSHML